MNETGDKLVIGSPSLYNADIPGTAYVYSRKGQDWVKECKLKITSNTSNKLGMKVLISSDNNEISIFDGDFKNRVGFISRGKGWKEVIPEDCNSL